MRASTFGPRNADRWYWAQAMRSLPSLLALWCQTVGLHRLCAIAALVVVARLFMLVLQFAALAIGVAAMSGLSGPATAFAIVASCLGAATLTGYVVRRIHARDAEIRIGALCVAVLVFHVVSPLLIHAAMPTWLYWVTTSPLSAIAVVVGATCGPHRTMEASV